jgi:hypothetical protein
MAFQLSQVKLACLFAEKAIEKSYEYKKEETNDSGIINKKRKPPFTSERLPRYAL